MRDTLIFIGGLATGIITAAGLQALAEEGDGLLTDCRNETIVENPEAEQKEERENEELMAKEL